MPTGSVHLLSSYKTDYCHRSRIIWPFLLTLETAFTIVTIGKRILIQGTKEYAAYKLFK